MGASIRPMQAAGLEVVEFVGPKMKGNSKYLAAALVGNDIYALPCSAHRVLRIHGGTGECELVGPDLGVCFDKYWSAVVVGRCVYGLPCCAGRVLKVDGSTGEVALVGPDLQGICKYVAPAVVGSCIYGVPYGSDAGRVLFVDCSGAQEKVELIGPELPDEGSKYGAAAVVDGRWVYGIPYSASRVLRIDGRSGAVELLAAGPKLLRGGAKYRCAVAVGRHVYGLPQNARHLLRVTHSDAVGECHVEKLPLPEAALRSSKSGGRGDLFSSAVALPSGQIYGLPMRAKHVLRVEGATGRAIVVGPELEGEGGDAYQCGAVIGDFIYVPPSGASRTLRIHTKSGEVETVGPELTGESKYVSAVAGEQIVYGIPLNAERVLRIRPTFFNAEETCPA